MMENKRRNSNKGRRQTQWAGLFVSEHAWLTGKEDVSDPQPMLSADEKQAIWDMLIVACDRKCPVFIQSWQDRHFHFHRCTILERDFAQRTITYEDAIGQGKLAIDTITSMHMLD
ncbi:hypothetical protein CXF70_13270 [Planomicrobium sp. MB-3u-38]|nr:hypothetical protein CXF70_13270 [Planomicrobium sp. MB-3u-38]